MLGLKKEEKITSYTNGPKGDRNKSRLENARKLLEQKASEGELGEETKQEYETYLISTKEINLTGSSEEIWNSIQGKTITYKIGEKDLSRKIITIQNFLELRYSLIIHGKVESTPVREIINAMLALKDEQKIKCYFGGNKGSINKKNIDSAKELLKKLALKGGLGEETKQDYEIYINTSSAEEIWNSIQGLTIQRQNQKDIRITTINDLIELSFTIIVKGKIGSTAVRGIFNRILSLVGDKKITCYTFGPKVEDNKLNVENAKISLKDKVLAGDLGEEAQREMQTIIESENIQNQINKEIKKI